MRSSFAVAAMALSLGSSAVLAAGGDEPIKLSDQELEQVTAGDKYVFTFNFILDDVYNSPVNTALVLQIAGSSTAIQSGTATAIQSALLPTPTGSGASAAGAQRTHPSLPSQAAAPAQARR